MTATAPSLPTICRGGILRGEDALLALVKLHRLIRARCGRKSRSFRLCVKDVASGSFLLDLLKFMDKKLGWEAKWAEQLESVEGLLLGAVPTPSGRYLWLYLYMPHHREFSSVRIKRDLWERVQRRYEPSPLIKISILQQRARLLRPISSIQLYRSATERRLMIGRSSEVSVPAVSFNELCCMLKGMLIPGFSVATTLIQASGTPKLAVGFLVVVEFDRELDAAKIHEELADLGKLCGVDVALRLETLAPILAERGLRGRCLAMILIPRKGRPWTGSVLSLFNGCGRSGYKMIMLDELASALWCAAEVDVYEQLIKVLKEKYRCVQDDKFVVEEGIKLCIPEHETLRWLRDMRNNAVVDEYGCFRKL
ncbi:hypothetical protein [Infirmifilum sp.]|uniref:hypothetical protein n=1 Tax=Infirmifilum sp. TaxID=2856575 RepID=UPI003D0FEEBF